MSQNLPLRSSSTLPTFTPSRSTSTSTSGFSPKPYLTLHDLYIRYAPLASLTSASLFKVSPPKVLPLMTLKDLFKKFASKPSNNSPLKSHATPRRRSNPPLPAKQTLSQTPPNLPSPVKAPTKSLRKRAVKKEGLTHNGTAPQASPPLQASLSQSPQATPPSSQARPVKILKRPSSETSQEPRATDTSKPTVVNSQRKLVAEMRLAQPRKLRKLRSRSPSPLRSRTDSLVSTSTVRGKRSSPGSLQRPYDRYSRSRTRSPFSGSQYSRSSHSRSSHSRSSYSRSSHSRSTERSKTRLQTKKKGNSKAQMEVYGDILRKLQFEELDQGSRKRIEELGLQPTSRSLCSSRNERLLSRPLREHNGPVWLDSYRQSSIKTERTMARAIFLCPWFEEY